MKTVFKIARTELRTLFYSPIAWFLMIVFFIQCALAYTGLLDGNARTQEMGGRGLAYMSDLTERIFTGRGSIFSSVMQNLYLYIPLLTMGLISREINGGTIKLLYSSPVKIQKIIFGKYLAMLVYSLVLVAIVGIFMVAGLFHIVAPESGMLVSAALGFFLLLCAYSAIGLFMSCLTTYQVVAAVATFVMIGILSYIGSLWQDMDFIRDLTYFLSLQGRTQHMLTGLITTKDIFYFIIIVYIFLGLSIFKLKGGRESKPAMVKAGRYAFIVISALLAGYLTSRPRLTGYLDLTANKTRTLTPQVQRIIGEMGDEKLEVTLYNNLLEGHAYYGLPANRNNYLSFWEPYTRFKPDIEYTYVNYYDTSMSERDRFMVMGGTEKAKTLKEKANMTAKNYSLKLSDFKTPEEILKIIDLKPEHNRFVMHLKYKDRSTFLRIFDDQAVFPSETEVAAAFKRLQLASIPKIAFLTGELERNINKMGEREYKVLTNLSTFRYALVNQGFDVDTLSLEARDIPDNISTLVIADPKVSLSAAALAKVRAYIDKGGNMLILCEPGKQDILNPIIQPLGVQLTEGAIAQPTSDLSPDLVQTYMTETAGNMSKGAGLKRKDSVVVAMPGATGLSYTLSGGYDVRPLLMTDGQKSWIRKDKLVTDSAAIVFSAGKGDLKGAVTTAIAMTRKVNGKEQRIVVTGDADFMSNNELQRSTIETSNFFFNTALFRWLSNGEFPVDTSRPDAKDKRVTVTPDNVAVLKIIFIWILPGLLLAFGTILLIRRKRK
jgi:ABC-2 type transport system permease protein